MPPTPMQVSDPSRGRDLAAFLDRVERDRVADLIEHGPQLLYQQVRHDVHTVAIRADELAADALRRLTEYRLAQYVRIGFAHPDRLVDALREQRSLSSSAPGDVHVLACLADGQLVCSAVLRTLPDVSETVRMRDLGRPLFPIEQVHGRGVFNRLRVLPDLPVAHVRELGGFVKNHSFERFDEPAIRAPIEVGVAVFRLLSGKFSLAVNALIGDLERSVAKLHLDYFGGRTVLMPATVAYLPDDAILAPRYENRAVWPFALLTSDSSHAVTRLAYIEEALEKPAEQAAIALLRLRAELDAESWSTLLPEAHADSLAAMSLSHHQLPMGQRRHLLDRVGRLLRLAPLQCLSRGEAAALAHCMSAIIAETDDVIIRRGDFGDALFFVEEGEALAVVDGPEGRSVVGSFGAGDYFGEMALLSGGPRTADVVAGQRTVLWRLSIEDYRTYLEQIGEVDRELAATAIARIVGRLSVPESTRLSPTCSINSSQQPIPGPSRPRSPA